MRTILLLLLCGSEKGNPVIKLMLDAYKLRDFITYDNWQDYITNQETSTCIYSNILGSLGIDRKAYTTTQQIDDFIVYPQSYFFTKDERLHISFIYRKLGIKEAM